MGKTRRVRPDSWHEYRRKAAAVLEAAVVCAEFSLWDAAVILSIHSAILMTDAVLIRNAGLCSASDNHLDAADLLRVHINGSSAARRQLAALIAVKNLVEYTGEQMNETRARELLKRAQRLFAWSKEHLPGR